MRAPLNGQEAGGYQGAPVSIVSWNFCLYTLGSVNVLASTMTVIESLMETASDFVPSYPAHPTTSSSVIASRTTVMLGTEALA